MRPKQILTVALTACVLLSTGSAMAANSNTGSPEKPSTGHVMTESPTGGVTILYAPSEADDAVLRGAIGAITGGTVDYYDARAGTPTLAEMQNYSCVFTWANFAFSNSILMGDNMADFVDGGGVAVLGSFSAYTSGNFLGGRIMTSGYSPVTGGSNHFSLSSYAGDGTTSLHENVVAYDATYRDILTLQGTGAQDGSYLDGEIAQAYNPAFSVIYSNGAGGVQLGGGGDWPQLIANACSGGGPGAPSFLEIPTLGKLGIAFLALALASGALLLLRRRSAA